jgi:hypothetical protein
MTTAAALARARRDDTARRRQRVLDVLAGPSESLSELSVAAIARAAGVHRSFLYRHPDLLAATLVHIANPPTAPGGTQVSRTSLLADLSNAAERNARLTRQITDLENALSRHLGQQVWRETGLGAPDETARLEARVAFLEQEGLDLRQQLEERDEELAAARAANRTLLAQSNRHPSSPA